jgi:hypothetical protein
MTLLHHNRIWLAVALVLSLLLGVAAPSQALAGAGPATASRGASCPSTGRKACGCCAPSRHAAAPRHAAPSADAVNGCGCAVTPSPKPGSEALQAAWLHAATDLAVLPAPRPEWVEPVLPGHAVPAASSVSLRHLARASKPSRAPPAC